MIDFESITFNSIPKKKEKARKYKDQQLTHIYFKLIGLLYLMEDKWTLQTTLAGAISQEIGLDFVQRGQHSAAGTAREDIDKK